MNMKKKLGDGEKWVPDLDSARFLKLKFDYVMQNIFLAV